MPLKQIGILVAVLVLAGALVLGYATTGEQNPVITDDITYVLAPVADGSYEGALPPLDREVRFSDTFPEEARRAVREHVADDVRQLEEHPEDGNAWMDLAVWYHTANDYDAARAIWEFIVDVSPTNSTALNNLGRLYHYTLPDFEKAEGYFTQALAANPERADAYVELFDLYRYSYKTETSAAVDIMKAAVQVFPDDPNFEIQLGVYYRDRGELAAARTYFERAVTKARATGQLEVVTTINAELAKLP